MTEKPTVLFCTGLSGSGKSYFIKNILPKDTFYNLKSATTRPMREGEMDGREYYFRNEIYFAKRKFATMLWVNQAFWKQGMPKWLYGVPTFEINNNWGKNFTYDVIQPRYVRQMIDWFAKNDWQHKYCFRVLWFVPMLNNEEVVKQRQNMPNDLEVRKANTCNMQDFKDANVKVDHIVVSNQYQFAIDNRLQEFLDSISHQR